LKRLIKAFGYVIFTLLAFVWFIPKVELYYALEELLEPQGIVISHEEVEDSGFALSLIGGDVSASGVTAGHNGLMDLTLLLAYNRFEIRDFRADEALRAFVPPEITFFRVTHHLLMPHKAVIEGEGDFGKAWGEVDLIERKIVIDLELPRDVVKRYGQLIKQLKRTEEGYRYEYTF